jgi:hypothetical protein
LKVCCTTKKPYLEEFEEEEESVFVPSEEGVRSIPCLKKGILEGGVVRLTREEKK